ncbi:MAG TPA: cytochrome c [Terriglobia bacterium]|nr:cytochrome c [Terriglobia bacterium]
MRGIWLFASVALCFIAPSLSAQTVWDGVYTADQAKRGQTAYSQQCVACHKPDLMGIEGALKGDAFIERRREDNLGTLFLDMKSTMPRGNPGGLPDQTYTDIISYLLQSNDMPPGKAELKPDDLEKIQLISKDGPKPVPNFVPVLSVGCLVEGLNHSWQLEQASEPVRTRDSFKKIDKELEESRTRALGEYTFRLQDADDFGAASHVDEKVQVKGVIVRSATGNRINVNSIEKLSESCP